MLIGRTPPRLPVDPLTDHPDAAVVSNMDQGGWLQQRLTDQRLAREAFDEALADSQIRRAALARNRRRTEWRAGQLVWYWRNTKAKQARGDPSTGSWNGPAVVLVQERRPDGNLAGNVWLSRGGYLMRCAPQHLREATPQEKLLYEMRQQDNPGSVDAFTRVVQALPEST